MSVLRIVYQKKNTSRFISANYIGKIFERCLRRISLPFKFSQGFNKRIRMSLGPPLAVGIAGNNEVIDIHVKNENVPGTLIKEFLNEVLPEGLRVVECRYLQETEKSPPEIKFAHYIIRIDDMDNFPIFPDFLRVIYVKNGCLKIEVKLEKLSHKQLFSIFNASNIIERFLIF